jgi:ABC-2 type transport system permease protein
MEASLDLSRWHDAPQGVGYRRWTIISTGLRQLFQLRFFKILLAFAWAAGVGLALLGLLFAQTVATGGWLETAAEALGGRTHAMALAVGGFVTLYPDVCIGGWFSLIFWVHSFVGLWLSLIALTVMVPRLITRDRATNALTVYLSRPLTTADYLLGKLGTIVGVLVMLWTGPLLFGWLLSVVLAPNRDFIIYSFEPLLRALLFHGIALVALASIALGVSAIGKTARNTIPIWIGLWLILGAVATPPNTPRWLQRASFTHNLAEVRQGVLRIDTALITAAESLPLIDAGFVRDLSRAGNKARPSDFKGALVALGIFVVISSFVFARKLRSE